MVRPNVAFAASRLSQFLTNPGTKHHRAADQAIRYLATTAQVALCFGGSSEVKALEIASDASFADDTKTRRSSQGYLIKLFSGPIIWKATRQTTITTSTTEAELLALEQTAKETMALKRMFRDLQLRLGEPTNLPRGDQRSP